jgi:hypothetical protein
VELPACSVAAAEVTFDARRGVLEIHDALPAEGRIRPLRWMPLGLKEDSNEAIERECIWFEIARSPTRIHIGPAKTI